MKLRAFIYIAVLGLCGITVAASAPTVTAQSSGNNSGQALEIAPPVLSLTAKPGETIKTELSLRNISQGKLLVTGQVNDFVAAGEDGTPKILLENDDNNPYSMKTWVGPLPTLLTVPREIKKLPVTIRVPANASPGGYYSVIRFTATPPELEGTGVSLSASLGSLVLLTVSGEVKHDLALEELSVSGAGKSGTLFEYTPLDFNVRLKNNGTIHEQPAGRIEITDMFDKKVATLSINQPPRNILPGSIRKFNAPLDSSVIGNKKLFGRYTAKLTATYGDNKQTITSQTTFWVIPYRVIGIAIAAMIISFFALRIMIRRYNQHIIKQAQKSAKSRRK